MNRTFLASAFAVAALATAAWAVSPAPAAKPAPAAAQNTRMENPFQRYDGPPKTRQEAIERTQARLQVLQKLSDEDWAKWQAERKERFEHFREHRQEMMGRMPQGDKKN